MIKFIKKPIEYMNTDLVTVTVETEADSLQDVVEAFEDFLRGCGYVFDGHLELVKDEDYEDKV